MILFALFAIASVNSYGILGASPTIKVTNIEKCDTDDEPVPWSFEISNVDANAYKKVNAEFDLSDFAFNDEISYTLDVDKLNDGDWKKDIYNDEGNLCDLIRQYVPKAWQKLMGALQPRPIDMCNAQKAVYRLKNFELLRQDVQLPAFDGKLRTTLRLFDKDDKNVFCTSTEVEVSR
ncbi:unnamed protein product [Ceutorhynchus assimilis]|uniref:Uncharacterized protein n=1 Tax=Ceutorhynchus assimilis TaxID=467358 RepID=A0A9N9MT76_9CUCU|nr:unnamed protein product [Ceutorhynchus assimilis]